MRTLYLTLLSLLLLFATARAQEAAPAMREQATAATRTLAAFVSLDDARQLPVRRLVQLRLIQEAEARTQYADDPTMLHNKLTAIGREYTTQLSTILSPAQLERLLAAAPNALPATVAAVRLAEPAPAEVLITASTGAPGAVKTAVTRLPAAASARSAAAKPRPRAPMHPVTPINSTIRH